MLLHQFLPHIVHFLWRDCLIGFVHILFCSAFCFPLNNRSPFKEKLAFNWRRKFEKTVWSLFWRTSSRKRSNRSCTANLLYVPLTNDGYNCCHLWQYSDLGNLSPDCKCNYCDHHDWINQTIWDTIEDVLRILQWDLHLVNHVSYDLFLTFCPRNSNEILHGIHLLFLCCAASCS